MRNRNTQSALDEVRLHINIYFGSNSSKFPLVVISNMYYYFSSMFFKMKAFREKHNEDLLKVKRVFDQMIQKTEANIAWMEKHYKDISQWLEQRKE